MDWGKVEFRRHFSLEAHWLMGIGWQLPEEVLQDLEDRGIKYIP